MVLCGAHNPLCLAREAMVPVPCFVADRPRRQYDVRDTERDKVVLQESFRPGDIVRARVISLGDARSYMLSTAAVDLGVVYAENDAGAPLANH